MKIKKLYGIKGARKATGLTVVVDIFRAATTASYILAHGAKYIIPVSTEEEAFLLKKENPSYLLAGEQDGYKIKGFDYGNSPFEISRSDIRDKIIVHRTTQGTQGLLNAVSADAVIFGSFTTVSSVRDYIKFLLPHEVSIVAMDGPESEDDKFAFFLEEMLLGGKPVMKPVVDYLKTFRSAQKFLSPSISEFPKEDFYLSLEQDKFNFTVIFQDKILVKKYSTENL
ncbi:MAG: 2-phosphosulfolactate phosphatase [Candidatus Eremiobacterota bacterium]